MDLSKLTVVHIHHGILCMFRKYNEGIQHTFLPHIAWEIRPPSSSPTGMLLIELISRPAQADNTTGFIDSVWPSFKASPRIAFAAFIQKSNINLHDQLEIFHFERQ